MHPFSLCSGQVYAQNPRLYFHAAGFLACAKLPLPPTDSRSSGNGNGDTVDAAGAEKVITVELSLAG